MADNYFVDDEFIALEKESSSDFRTLDGFRIVKIVEQVLAKEELDVGFHRMTIFQKA